VDISNIPLDLPGYPQGLKPSGLNTRVYSASECDSPASVTRSSGTHSGSHSLWFQPQTAITEFTVSVFWQCI